MAFDFDKWNAQFGGAQAVKELEEAAKGNGNFDELPDADYVCKLEKLELAESKQHKPMIKGQFRIVRGEHKKQCLFVNQVFTRGFPQHKGLEFLRSLQVFDDSEIDFDGDFVKFNDLIMDIAEEAVNLIYTVRKSKDGDYTRLEVLDVKDA